MGILRSRVYSACLVLAAYNLDDETCLERTVERRVVLIVAGSFEEALGRARRYGQEAAIPATESSTGFEFIAVDSMWEVGIECEGDEPWYQIEELESAEVERIRQKTVEGDGVFDKGQGDPLLDLQRAFSCRRLLEGVTFEKSGVSLIFEGNVVVTLVVEDTKPYGQLGVESVGSHVEKVTKAGSDLVFRFSKSTLRIRVTGGLVPAAPTRTPARLPTGGWWLVAGIAAWKRAAEM